MAHGAVNLLSTSLALPSMNWFAGTRFCGWLDCRRDVGPEVPLPIRVGHVLCVGDDWLVANSLAEVLVRLRVLLLESDILY